MLMRGLGTHKVYSEEKATQNIVLSPVILVSSLISGTSHTFALVVDYNGDYSLVFLSLLYIDELF